MLAVGKPERAAALVAVHDLAAQLEGRAEEARCQLDLARRATSARMWLEETISPSTSTSGTTRVSKRPSAASISGSPAARCPKRKFSPTETCVACSRSTRMWSMNSCGVWCGEAVVERDHDELVDAERGDQLGLGVEAGQQLRRRLGPDDLQRVRLEREHRVAAADHLAVAEVDAVEFADRDPTGARLDVG